MDSTLALTQGDGIFIAAGLVGMAAHYIKKIMRKETSSNFTGYFGKDNVRATLATFGAFGMAVLSALGTGLITPDMNLYAIVYSGLTTGFAIDSSFNSGADVEPVKEE